MASIGSLVVNLGANLQGLQKGLQKAQGMVGSFASRTASAVSSAVRSAAGITATLGAGGLTAGLVGAVKMAADAEQLAIQLEVLSGSAEKANSLIANMRSLALESPFDAQDLIEATKVMISFGVSADKAASYVSSVSEIAAGDAEKLSRLTLAFSQAAAAGRLMGQDVLQMVNAGFNPLQEISLQTGESIEQLRTRMEDGAISFEEVASAFERATKQGGRFFGMNDRMAQTTIGRWQKITEQIGNLARTIGTALLPAVKDILDIIERSIAEFDRWGESGEGAIGGIMRAIKNGDMQAAFKLVVLELKLMWTEMVSDFIVSWMEAARKINRTVNRQVFSEDKITAAIIGAGTDVANVKDEISKLRHEQFWAARKAMNGAAANPGDMPAAAMAQAVANGEGGGIDPFFGLKNPLQQYGVREASSGAFDLAAAMQRGSAEAYSTLVRAGRRDNADPAAQAVDKQTKALLQPLNQLAGAFVGGLPGVLIVESI